MAFYLENNESENDKRTEDILVSIIVITYNSERYVVETLDSAKAQSYEAIELIISDDCSTDKTEEVCRQWLKENKSRFFRSVLISSEQNRGIPANCNRGVNAAQGDWLKLIAGDDILAKDCIKNNIDYAISNSDSSIISSSIQLFTENTTKKNFGRIIIPEDYFFGSAISARQQYNILLRRNFVHGPSVMIKKSAILNVGGFDEKYKLFEDHPMFLKLTSANYKIYGLNKITVYYRRHNSSVLMQEGDKIFSDFYLKIRAFEIDYLYPNITVTERIARNIEFLRLRLFDCLGLNKETCLNKYLFLISERVNPARIILSHALKKQIQIFNN